MHVNGIQNKKNHILLVKSWMFPPFQTHTGFPIENYGVNFHGGQISPIDSMLTGDNQELSMLSEI